VVLGALVEGFRQTRGIMPVQGISDHVEVRPGLRLRVIRWGEPSDKTPFLLVHGLASNARMWDGCGAVLAEQGHYAIAVDQRGHGLSDKPDDGYDFATVTDDLLALIAAEGLDRPVVAGQSWGGNVVVELGWRAPELVRGIVPVDGGVIELGAKFPDWDDCKSQLAPPNLLGTRWTRLEAMMRAAHGTWPESGIAGSMANFEQLDDGTIRPWLSLDRHLQILRALWEHKPSARFPEMRTPVLFAPADSGKVSWTADKRASIEAAEAAIPGPARTEWFSPADHDLHAQFPQRFAELLISESTTGLFA
jgi:pimeloyl-ACP methyl ester carboxylesterase